ncbi:hypothetical protein HDU92_007408 [Lobulomyces angularis]|nr:hypothetical protein HDU92_007408 [Lobulomyces angularis]
MKTISLFEQVTPSSTANSSPEPMLTPTSMNKFRTKKKKVNSVISSVEESPKKRKLDKENDNNSADNHVVEVKEVVNMKSDNKETENISSPQQQLSKQQKHQVLLDDDEIAEESDEESNEIFKYKCEVNGCVKAYKNPGGLKYHIQRGKCEETGDTGMNHIISRPFVCNFPECGKRYKNLNGLKYHLTHSHSEISDSATQKLSLIDTFSIQQQIQLKLQQNIPPSIPNSSKSSVVSSETVKCTSPAPMTEAFDEVIEKLKPKVSSLSVPPKKTHAHVQLTASVFGHITVESHIKNGIRPYNPLMSPVTKSFPSLPVAVEGDRNNLVGMEVV